MKPKRKVKRIAKWELEAALKDLPRRRRKPRPVAAERDKEWIKDAAALLIAAADEYGRDLVEVIAEMERHIVEGTKVGDAKKETIPPGRRGYTLKNGRLVTVQ